jgi:hypothetical protein
MRTEVGVAVTSVVMVGANSANPAVSFHALAASEPSANRLRLKNQTKWARHRQGVATPDPTDPRDLSCKGAPNALTLPNGYIDASVATTVAREWLAKSLFDNPRRDRMNLRRRYCLGFNRGYGNRNGAH